MNTGIRLSGNSPPHLASHSSSSPPLPPSPSPSAGFVEMRGFRFWRRVCDNNFQSNDADRVCRALGFGAYLDFGAANENDDDEADDDDAVSDGRDAGNAVKDDQDDDENREDDDDGDVNDSRIGWKLECGANETRIMSCRRRETICPGKRRIWIRCDHKSECKIVS